jgi:hypothetical protein
VYLAAWVCRKQSRPNNHYDRNETDGRTVWEQCKRSSGAVLAMTFVLRALRNSRQENCIILLTYTSGVINKLHPPPHQSELYQHPFTQENPPSTLSIHCNFHFHSCERRSTHAFPFTAPRPARVFTSGTLCSQASLVRRYLSHSLFSNVAMTYRQLLSNRKPTLWLKLHASNVTYASVHHNSHCHSFRDNRRSYDVSVVDFTSAFRCLVVTVLIEWFLPSPVATSNTA